MKTMIDEHPDYFDLLSDGEQIDLPPDKMPYGLWLSMDKKRSRLFFHESLGAAKVKMPRKTKKKFKTWFRKTVLPH